MIFDLEKRAICASDDFTTWSKRDLLEEIQALKRDHVNGGPDESDQIAVIRKELETRA